MNNLSLVDVFFIITGAAVVIITVMLAIGLIYVISFVRTVKKIAHTAHRTSEVVSEDLMDFSRSVREKGFSVGTLMDFVKAIGRKRIIRKK